jgi:transposase InsO family protein
VIRDLYDNSIVAYKTGTEQTIHLVLNTIRAAKRNEKVTAELQLHSDQGFQYTSQAYFKLTQSYGITLSMSRSGNPYDNSLALPGTGFTDVQITPNAIIQKIFNMYRSRLLFSFILFRNYRLPFL